ncbi:MAG: SMC-Scp complex subunit ScpB [Acidobacteriota bacterium]|nr:SMC-Scp complex subunit ScpB [Acidobacteriota bacterium]MDE3043794.1 SMC-Scp complex subunit ScpB [Acidobacteriota bacterium]MDE3106688.1 SMC-Scp complex subunit ScpB [Acidobacteriota bacterium]MDE3223240.1 SMC-Scp complex subunit ScpB [Acidobacteriota bacterium]
MRAEGSLEQRVEALLTVALEPISAEELADVLDADATEVASVLRALRQECLDGARGYVFTELASGWTMQSAPEVAEWVSKFANRDVSHRLSSAALETLAIIAYRQPVSRAQITALRGVNVDGVVRLLEQRGYVEEKGRAGGPGQPILYGTTELFLDRLGLASVADLPALEQFMDPVETAHALADELSTRIDMADVG